MKDEFGQKDSMDKSLVLCWRFFIPDPSSFILLTCLLLLAPSLVFAGPKIVSAKSVFEFGEVESGAKVKAEFEIANEGDADLVIQEVKVTCDCTEAYAEPMKIPPKGKGKVFATLNTSYRVGDLEKTVIVITNDIEHAEVGFQIRGKTWLPLTFKSSPLYMDGLAPGADATDDVTLMNTGKGPITIKSFTPSEPDVTLEIKGKGDAKVTLPVTLKPEDYLWVHITIKIPPDAKRTLYRRVAVTADPAPLTPLILKIQATADTNSEAGNRNAE